MSGRLRRLLLVYPAHGNAFYAGLAARLHAACTTFLDQVALVSSLELCALEPDSLADLTIGAVNPYECALTDRAVVERIQRAPRRIMILAEAIGTEWYEKQFSLPIEFDAIFDVGFISQAKRHRAGMPYWFVLNAPTEEERSAIAGQVPGARPIPWAVVGHYTEARLALGSRLVDGMDPTGVLFLPRLRAVRRDHGLISPSALRELLSRTRYYVWCAHHRVPYYESFRFLEALLAGAVPCKIDDTPEVTEWGIPGIFRSIDAFCATAREAASASLYTACRDFYLKTGTLAHQMEEALARV